MPLINSINYYLKDLKIDPETISDLNDEQRYHIVLRQWINLILVNHPDNDPDNYHLSNTYRNINEAYHKLTCPALPQTTIRNYLPLLQVQLPFHAFDMTMQHNIENKYIELINTFNSLQTEEEKSAFVQQYATFLVLGDGLFTHRLQIITARADAFFKQTHTSYVSSMYFIGARLLIRYFGIELLDDFQYRRAIASGHLYPILDRNKLLNPIKLLLALINLPLVLLLNSFKYYLSNITRQIYIHFFLLLYDASNASSAIYIGIYMTLLLIPFYFVPYLPLLMAASALMTIIIDGLACPWNAVIRPLNQYLQSSTVFSIALLSALVLGGVGISLFLPILPFLSTHLVYLNVALQIYIGFATLKLIWKCYQLSPIILLVDLCILGIRSSLAPNINAPVSHLLQNPLSIFLMRGNTAV
ncbi:MAG TPA: hypothetical protein VHD33_06765, partial [Legionellaceae bacterium]|nr:hypothetical protein [Legionellaceae bacterium]